MSHHGVIFLSHELSSRVPVYGVKDAKLEMKNVKSIQNGDSCYTYWIGMENHWGTHVDAPAHFFENASAVCDYPPEFWIFKHPQVAEVRVKENELIGVEALEGAIQRDTDFLILKTGFQRFRGQEKYSQYNPGVKAEAGNWLREKFGFLRAIGFDFVSISCFQNREEGRKAHRAFLDPQGVGHPILIVEDMNLRDDLQGLNEVWVVPLRVAGVDSSPCTVMGVLK
ncbi:MAG: cyclase family protein [Candidatus Omnitrophota bacterium]